MRSWANQLPPPLWRKNQKNLTWATASMVQSSVGRSGQRVKANEAESEEQTSMRSSQCEFAKPVGILNYCRRQWIHDADKYILQCLRWWGDSGFCCDIQAIEVHENVFSAVKCAKNISDLEKWLSCGAFTWPLFHLPDYSNMFHYLLDFLLPHSKKWNIYLLEWCLKRRSQIKLGSSSAHT